jgi:Immune inhibitor A-like, MAM domain
MLTTTSRTSLVITLLASSLMLCAACSDDPPALDGGQPDGPPADAAVKVDADAALGDAADAALDAAFWPCEEPGKPCVAADPCAVEATCSADKLCKATKLQDCDDKLACTADSCKGLGICENKPKKGFCLIPAQSSAGKLEPACFKRSDKQKGNACMLCDDVQDPRAWTALSNVPCDDGVGCTQSDSCKFGVCAGTDYSATCSDGHPCTEDLCDGKGGCLGTTHPLKTGWCLIGGLCYKDGEGDPASKGCQRCVAATSPKAWVTLTTKCTIDGSCYKPQEISPDRCGTCDPSKSISTWTPYTTGCKISGRCYTSNEKDKTGCASCSPTFSKSVWKVAASKCVINRSCHQAAATGPVSCAQCVPASSGAGWTPYVGKCLIGRSCYNNDTANPLSATCLKCDASKDPLAWSGAKAVVNVVAHGFESGTLGGWTASNSEVFLGWTVSDKRSRGGSYALYYGNPIDENYIGFGANSGQVSVTTTLGAGKAGIWFMLYMDTEKGSTYDKLVVKANGTAKWTKDSTDTVTLKAWQAVHVDLSAYAGKTVTITFDFDTTDGALNATEGVYIDDLTIYSGC